MNCKAKPQVFKRSQIFGIVLAILLFSFEVGAGERAVVFPVVSEVLDEDTLAAMQVIIKQELLTLGIEVVDVSSIELAESAASKKSNGDVALAKECSTYFEVLVSQKEKRFVIEIRRLSVESGVVAGASIEVDGRKEFMDAVVLATGTVGLGRDLNESWVDKPELISSSRADQSAVKESPVPKAKMKMRQLGLVENIYNGKNLLRLQLTVTKSLPKPTPSKRV